jgi:signal peptidase II
MNKFFDKETVARPKNDRAFLSRLDLKPVPDLTAHIIFWFSAAAGIALDLWSKSAVFKFLQDRHTDGISIINGFLQIVWAENTGAAFGVAAGKHRFLMIVSALSLIVIVLLFLFGSRKTRLFYLALAFFVAGISGNLHDRFFNDGRVRDFIDFIYWPGKHWPAFNVADSLLCIAVGIILLLNFTGSLYQKPPQPQK